MWPSVQKPEVTGRVCSTTYILREAGPAQPVQLLHFRDGKILSRVSSMPNWAKPIAAVAISLAK